jgi:hypothetical protein
VNDGAREPEAEYYQSVEEFFVSRRGDPLFLSNPDWLLVREWRRAGIPLRIVLRGIADALDAHAHSFSRTRKVGSLAYCKAEVETARERWERAVGPGEEAAASPRDHLGHLAAQLEDARLPGERAAAVARLAASELTRRASQEVRLREVEPRLQELEARLVAALAEDMGEAAADEVRAEAERALAPYRERLPERLLREVSAEAFARRMLERHGLPRLSLVVLE